MKKCNTYKKHDRSVNEFYNFRIVLTIKLWVRGVKITVILFNLGTFISENMLIHASMQPQVVTLKCYKK